MVLNEGTTSVKQGITVSAANNSEDRQYYRILFVSV
jgi:hypothetical protein